MPRTLKYSRTIFVLFAVVALAATGSAGPGAGSTDPGDAPRTGAHTVVTGSDRNPWCGEGEASHVKDTAADLRGAHFTLTAQCLFQGAEIPERMASPDLTALPPTAPGVEFLFAQFAAQADYLPDIGGDPDWVSAWIEAGSDRIDLAEAPGLGSFLVLSVPVDEPAVLWVDDDGRAQGLDLRTGAQVDPVTAYYADLGFWTEPMEGFAYEDLRHRSGSEWWEVSCARSIVDLTRSAWTPTDGWALEGTVFLTVQFSWCGAHDDPVTWSLDTERSMTAFHDSEMIMPAAWRQEPNGDGGEQFHTVVFVVPAEAADFKVLFVPAGEVVERSTGDVFRPEMMPPITEWSISF